MIVGGIANLRGLCPVCGTDVDRTHEWNGSTVGDTYACPDCGETEYTVDRRTLAAPGTA